MGPIVRRLFVVMAPLLVLSGSAGGHPFTQGTINATVLPDRVDLAVRVTVEEAAITNLLVEKDPLKPVPSSDTPEAFDLHAAYVADHLIVLLDGKPLTGSVVRVTPPADVPAGEKAVVNPTTIPTTVPAAMKRMATYELTYKPAAAASVETPKLLEIRSNVLKDVDFSFGTKWEASYVVNVRRGARMIDQALLLTLREPVTVELPPVPAPTAPTTAPGAIAPNESKDVGSFNRGRVLRNHLVHGFHHILEGWDHLLFITALTLAAVSLWDLVKVVSVFTIAHTVTLTLSALRMVHVSSQIVEPMIALSIIFVAVQNIFWPKRSRGWIRLAAAFFFGLFHGLGFAGGLLEAMQGMAGAVVVIAILGFSVGVEVGHQVIVIPLFAGLKIVRTTRSTPQEKELFSFRAQRIGSALISVAGVYFLVVALREAMH